jgi:hypothetical protein
MILGAQVSWRCSTTKNKPRVHRPSRPGNDPYSGEPEPESAVLCTSDDIIFIPGRATVNLFRGAEHGWMCYTLCLV